MTVLAETEEVDDPVCEMMKSLLDGHIILSRALAAEEHFPAIDVLKSVSRQSLDLMSDLHAVHAQQVAQWLNRYESSRLLIEAGLYAAGANVETDRALKKRAGLLAFLKQAPHENVPFARGLSALAELCEGEM